MPGYPDVPTMAEAGFAGVGTLHWQSMLAPAATPKPVIDTLFKAIVEASKQPALKEAFDKQLVSIKLSESPDEAKTWLKGELDTWRKITSRSEDRSGGVDDRGQRLQPRPGIDDDVRSACNEALGMWLVAVALPRALRIRRAGAGQISVEADQDRAALRRGQRDRHHHAHHVRAVAPELGQSCVVENKPGAFGIIAIEEMARARPDGYTLQVGNVSTNAITPVLFKNKLTIDYEKDVVAVARLADLPTFLMTTARNFPPKTHG